MSRALTLLAFAAIYIIWGSTYLAIAIAIEGIPPLLMASLRFLPAAIVMILWGVARGSTWPGWRDTMEAFIVGTLMLSFGNGAVSFVEDKMPSGVAALLVAMVPIWVVVFEAMGRRKFPRPAVVFGVMAGLAGVGLLSQTDAGWVGGAVDPWYVVIILTGAACWAYGSLRSRNSRIDSLRMRAGMQMLGGSASLALMAVLHGDRVDWRAVPVASWQALAFLTIFGSIIAFTAYIWLLRNVPAPAVATYAFVNPVVALALGAWILGEPITWQTLVAAALIIVAVITINRASAKPALRAMALDAPADATATSSK